MNAANDAASRREFLGIMRFAALCVKVHIDRELDDFELVELAASFCVICIRDEAPPNIKFIEQQALQYVIDNADRIQAFTKGR